MEDRIKRPADPGRAARGMNDRNVSEDRVQTDQERRRALRNEFQFEALPRVPEIPGYHLCWLSTTNQGDPIHKRMRLGYELVRQEDLQGFDQMRLKSGQFEGGIGINEMILFKIANERYQDLMVMLHHDMPSEEEGRIQEQVRKLSDHRDSSNRPLVQIDGDGLNFGTTTAPVFEG